MIYVDAKEKRIENLLDAIDALIEQPLASAWKDSRQMILDYANERDRMINLEEFLSMFEDEVKLKCIIKLT